jgi:hypothetical protein
MTNDEKLLLADKLVSEVWSEVVPDRAPLTLAEDVFFQSVEAIASRIISDIDQLRHFNSDVES